MSTVVFCTVRLDIQASCTNRLFAYYFLQLDEMRVGWNHYCRGGKHVFMRFGQLSLQETLR